MQTWVLLICTTRCAASVGAVHTKGSKRMWIAISHSLRKQARTSMSQLLKGKPNKNSGGCALLGQLRALRDSPIMHSSVPDEFKPVIFAGGLCIATTRQTHGGTCTRPPPRELPGTLAHLVRNMRVHGTPPQMLSVIWERLSVACSSFGFAEECAAPGKRAWPRELLRLSEKRRNSQDTNVPSSSGCVCCLCNSPPGFRTV